MIVYHGSNRNFRVLRISNSLVQRESTKTNEGIGIYFSTDRETAEVYGNYLYILDINENYFIDFRKKQNCKRYIQQIRDNINRETFIDIAKYADLDTLVDRMYLGGQAISGVSNEIYMLLDSNYEFYQLPKTKIETIYRILRTYDKKHLNSYMFNYHIKNIGVIKNVSNSRVIIKDKIKLF
jgi:hypothetical protein